MRGVSNIGDKGSQRRGQWKSALNLLRAACGWFGVTVPGLPANFLQLLRPAANQAAAGIVTSATNVLGNQGVATGSGPMMLSRAASMYAEAQAAYQALTQQQATPAPAPAPAPAPGNQFQQAANPYQPPPYTGVPGAATQSGLGGLTLAQMTPAPGFDSAAYAAQVGGVAPGGGGIVGGQEGPIGRINLPAAGGAYSGQALGALVAERAREIQSDLDEMPEYGEVTSSGAPTVGKLSGTIKVRQESGYLDALLISGTAGKTATLWVHARVTPKSATDSSESDDWDDGDAVTAVTDIVGKPYAIIIPEDGYVVVPIRIEGAVVLGVEAKDTSVRVSTSRFKSAAHCRYSGGGHFSALARG
jgi:hypothetical protein